MRKIFTLFVICFFVVKGVSQTCTATSEASFVTCTETMGVTEINITNAAPNPLVIGSEFTVNLAGKTINLPNNSLLIFNGDIIVDAGTTFDGTGMSQVRIVILGETYTGNEGSGNTLTDLNSLFDDCIPDPEIGGCSLAELLPVELTRFEAQSKNDMIELSWTTATELNNDFFQIEHSRDGVQFAVIGKVKGFGTTTETVNYDFMHRQPEVGTNYYRLKQVDFDGVFAYSPIVAAEVNTRAGAISLFPNPTVNKVNVLMHKRPEKITFRLSNLVGQQLDFQPAETDNGWEIDLTRLPRGIYLLRMEYDGKTITKRLVKE